jgi:hypothetical protein
MIDAVFRLALACSIAFTAAGTAQASGAMAKVSGWIGAPSSIPVYSADGAPHGRQDLSRVAVAGLRQWNPDFDLVKISGDPADDRWVPAKHLNLVFCDPVEADPSAPGVGRPANNKALSYGSGEKCRQ